MSYINTREGGFFLLRGPILVLTVIFSSIFQISCTDPEICTDVKESSRSYENIAVRTIRLRHSSVSLVDEVSRLELSRQPQHFEGSAQLQLLDQNKDILFEKSVQSFKEAHQKLGFEIIKQGDPMQIAMLDHFFDDQIVDVKIPATAQSQFLRVLEKNFSEVSKPATTAPNMLELSLKDFKPETTELALPNFQNAIVTPLHFSGSQKNRLNIAILADGYLQEDLDQFGKESKELTEHLLEQSPFKEYKDYLNLWSIFIPSKERGAKCDDGKNENRKNVFGSVFPVACINAVFGTSYSDRAPMQTNGRAIRAALNLVGDDIEVEPFILINSKKSGGAAILWATQTNVVRPSIFPHELGHSFGNLADEYVADSDLCYWFNLFKPNISLAGNSRQDVKWNQWIQQDTPIPTPDTNVFAQITGLFQGASNCPTVFYRPARTCKMKESHRSYCAICKEQLVLRLYDFVRPFEGKLISHKLDDGSYEFSAPLIRSEFLTRWLVDNREVVRAPSYKPLVAYLPKGKHAVRLEVMDPSSFVRKDLCHLAEAQSIEVTVE